MMKTPEEFAKRWIDVDADISQRLAFQKEIAARDKDVREASLLEAFTAVTMCPEQPDAETARNAIQKAVAALGGPDHDPFADVRRREWNDAVEACAALVATSTSRDCCHETADRSVEAIRALVRA